MSYTEKALKGFVIVFVINVIAAFLGYLIRIVLARNLTAAEYGLFFSVFTLINLIIIFTDFGLGQALVKFIPAFQAKKKQSQIKFSLMLTGGVTFGFTLLLAFLVFLFSGYLANNYFKTPLAVPVLLLFIPLMFFSSLKNVLHYVYQAFQKMVPFSLMYFFENLLIFVLLLIWFHIQKNVFVAVYSHIIVYAIILLVFLVLFFRVFDFFKHKIIPEKEVVKNLFRFGVPILLSTFGGLVILYTDTLVLTYFRTLEEVGAYNVVVPTVMMVMFLPNAIATVIFPMISELWAKGKKQYITMGVRLLETNALILILPLVVLLFSFAELILKLFFGMTYLGGAPTMRILLCGIIFFGMYAITSAVLSGIGKPTICSKVLLQGAAINLILNLLLIPSKGMIGAAISSMLSYFYVAVVASFYLRKFVHVEVPWLKWIKTAFAGGIMFVIIFVFEKLLFVNPYIEAVVISVIAFAVYTALIFLLKAADIKDLTMLLKSASFKKRARSEE